MLKKLITAILLIAVLFSQIVTATGIIDLDKTEEVSQTDNPYAHAVTVLKALKVIDDTFSDSAAITRADLVKIIVFALNIDDLSMPEGTKILYSDVPAGYWAESSIIIATNLEIVNGYSDGSFGPNDIVTYQDAVKIIVNLLGYSLKAEAKGGYPSGFMAIASEIKLLNGVGYNANEAFTGGMIAQMLYNALEVKIQNPVTFGREITYEVYKDYNILSLKDMFAKNGILNQTNQTSLANTEFLQDGKVKIDDIIYFEGDSGASKYLGYKVKVYARQTVDEDIPTIIYIEPHGLSNASLKINSDDIERTYMSGTDKVIEYEKNDRTLKISLKASADVIYNGNAAPQLDISKFKPTDGYITLLDNDGDQKYDVIFIKNYQTYVAASISVSTGIIVDQLGKPNLELDKRNFTEYNFSITNNSGLTVNLDAVKQWDILLVAVSETGSKAFKEVLLSSQKLTGTIDEAWVDEKSNRFCTANGVFYGISDAYEKIINVGDSGIYAIDAFGRIAYLQDTVETSWIYGFIIGVNFNISKIDDVAIKLIDSDATIATYFTADSVILDGIKQTQSNLKTGTTNLSSKRQLIAYKLNKLGRISAIETKYNTAEDAKVRLDGEMRRGIDRKYNKNIPVLATPADDENSYAIKNGAMVFLVPDLNAEDNPGADFSIAEEDYYVRESSYFLHDETYKCEIYNVDDNYYTNLVVVSNEDATTFQNSVRPALIERVTSTTNANGELTYKIYGYNQGNVFSELTAVNMVLGSVDPKNLKAGDIVRFLKNYQGEINYIERIIDYANIDVLHSTSNTYDGEPMLVLAKLMGIKGTQMLVATKYDSSTGKYVSLRHYNTHVLPVIIFDRNNPSDPISIGTMADVYAGCNVFFRSSDAYLSDVIVYKQD